MLVKGGQPQGFLLQKFRKINECTEAGGSIDRWSLYQLLFSTGPLLHNRKSQVCELSMHADWRCTHYFWMLAWERGPSVKMNSAMQRVKLGERNASCVFQHQLLHFSVYYGSWACVICVSVYVWVCICVCVYVSAWICVICGILAHRRGQTVCGEVRLLWCAREMLYTFQRCI